jgi:hypothetical protein
MGSPWGWELTEESVDQLIQAETGFELNWAPMIMKTSNARVKPESTSRRLGRFVALGLVAVVGLGCTSGISFASGPNVQPGRCARTPISAARTGWAPARQELVPGNALAVVLCRYSGVTHKRSVLEVQRMVRSQSVIRDLAKRFDALPPPGSKISLKRDSLTITLAKPESHLTVTIANGALSKSRSLTKLLKNEPKTSSTKLHVVAHVLDAKGSGATANITFTIS